jgi:hypothetical protein
MTIHQLSEALHRDLNYFYFKNSFLNERWNDVFKVKDELNSITYLYHWLITLASMASAACSIAVLMSKFRTAAAPNSGIVVKINMEQADMSTDYVG